MDCIYLSSTAWGPSGQHTTSLMGEDFGNRRGDNDCLYLFSRLRTSILIPDLCGVEDIRAAPAS